MAEDIRIHLLGPVHVTRGDARVDPGPPRQRAALALLASQAGSVVPMQRLVDALWESPPRSAEQSVYTYVAGLRRLLDPVRGRREPSALLTGVAGGYVLHLDPSQVDSCRFDRLAGRARRASGRGDHDGAARLARQALALWGGEPLTGVPGPFAEAERARLAETHVSVMVCLAQSLLDLDRPHDALTPLRELVRLHPLRERPYELLMLALHGCGRRAEALAAYDEAARVLGEELEVEPGPPLRRARRLVLGDPGPRGEPFTPPRELPRDLDGFVGRAVEIIRLKSVLAPWDDAPPCPLAVISGPPGVGKSALAVRIANLVQDRFPHGQLYVALRGATAGLKALEPLAVLHRLLRALGTDPSALPDDVDEAAAAWRARVRGRRMLVLLDNAAGLWQIRPLLSPPPGTSILVTSRETLVAGDDCVQVHVPPLPESEAVTMLARLAGARRVAADPARTAELVRLCDGLPLALRIAGARLADRPGWSVAALTARLRDEQQRLHELESGELAVRASLLASWRALDGGSGSSDRPAARALACLGLLHVHDVTAEVVAALLDSGRAGAERALERLVDAHLLDRARPGDGGDDRYHLHDLVRLFAQEVAPAGDTAPLVRALNHYIASARLATVTMDPSRVQPDGPAVDAVPHRVRGVDEAHDWLVAEEANLAAAAAQAMASPDEAVARLGMALCFSLAWYHHHAHDTTYVMSLNDQALKLAERLGDRQSAYHAHAHLAQGLTFLRRLPEAEAHLRAKLAIARELGDLFGEQRALGNLARVAVQTGRHEEALRLARAQAELAGRIGAEVGVRYAGMIRGMAERGLGRPAEARRSLESALASAEREGDMAQGGSIRMLIGELLLDEGRHREALAHLERALEYQRSCWLRGAETQCLLRLARAHRSLGEPHRALAYALEALPLAEELGDPEWLAAARAERAAAHEALGVPGTSPL